jgi:hypothetical protein
MSENQSSGYLYFSAYCALSHQNFEADLKADIEVSAYFCPTYSLSQSQ